MRRGRQNDRASEGQRGQGGPVADTEDPLDLEHAGHQVQTPGLVPLLAEQDLGHQELSGERVGLHEVPKPAAHIDEDLVPGAHPPVGAEPHKPERLHRRNDLTDGNVVTRQFGPARMDVALHELDCDRGFWERWCEPPVMAQGAYHLEIPLALGVLMEQTSDIDWQELAEELAECSSATLTSLVLNLLKAEPQSVRYLAARVRGWIDR